MAEATWSDTNESPSSNSLPYIYLLWRRLNTGIPQHDAWTVWTTPRPRPDSTFASNLDPLLRTLFVLSLANPSMFSLPHAYNPAVDFCSPLPYTFVL